MGVGIRTCEFDNSPSLTGYLNGKRRDFGAVSSGPREQKKREANTKAKLSLMAALQLTLKNKMRTSPGKRNKCPS